MQSNKNTNLFIVDITTAPVLKHKDVKSNF